jgi:hypothetical protein
MSVHTVERGLDSPVTVKSISLFLAHDGRQAVDANYKLRDARARGVTKFELYADTGSGFESVLVADVVLVDGGDTGLQPPGEPVCPSPECFGLYDPVYGGAMFSVPAGTSFVNMQVYGGYPTISADIPATTSGSRRAEFTQFGNFLDWYSDTGGSRILELVGLPDPQFQQPVAVLLDIKPGSCPNPYKYGQKGVLPVAIVETQDFDVAAVLVDSIRLNGGCPVEQWAYGDAAEPYEDGFSDPLSELDCCEYPQTIVLPGGTTVEEVDGITDLALKFDAECVRTTVADPAGIPYVQLWTITGQYLDENGDEIEFTAEDAVRVR